MLSRRSLAVFLLSSLAAAAVSLGRVADAPAADGGPATFISKVGQEAINSLTGRQLSDEEREDRFRKILNRSFKVDLIARFTLGRYWRLATEQQKKEYARLFEDFIVQAYAARFKDYSGENFSVGRVRDINDRDKLVQSTLTLKDGRQIPVHWRVRSDGSYMIVDVLVEGVSMAITQRDEFAAIINQSGGKVEGLLTALRQKTGK
jgi:phospholipid transport system substrate-binding protein